MRRWNGWGDESTHRPLNDSALSFLKGLIGDSTATDPVSLESVLAKVPASRLKGGDHLYSTDPDTRLRRATGQSFSDWIGFRYGTLELFPDGIATPRSRDEVRAIIQYAKDSGCRLIPYGGGTSVVGHLTPDSDSAPVLTVDMSAMSQLMELDKESQLATFGAGVPGPQVEAQLKPHGYLLGHFPQSYELSTLGGWVVTRSSGQQSARYGRIENMFAGGHVETPIGSWDIPSIPATGAGNDVREMVLGSEGRIGILTDVQVRVTPLPEMEKFVAIFFPDWETGMAAVRSMAQAKLPLSMMRLSNPVETDTQLRLAGHETTVSVLESYLRVRGVGQGKTMMMIGVTGSKKAARAARADAQAIASDHNGVTVGTKMGDLWAANRFLSPYLRDTLWEYGYGVDTVETCTNWSNVSTMMNAIENAASDALAQFDEKVHAFTHLSHVYPQGSSVYSTFIFRLTGDPDQDLARWQKLKGDLSQTIVDNGGTISHQHGVGLDHKPYLPKEKGQLGIGAIQNANRYFDPEGFMNPGKTVD